MSVCEFQKRSSKGGNPPWTHRTLCCLSWHSCGIKGKIMLTLELFCFLYVMKSMARIHQALTAMVAQIYWIHDLQWNNSFSQIHIITTENCSAHTNFWLFFLLVFSTSLDWFHCYHYYYCCCCCSAVVSFFFGIWTLFLFSGIINFLKIITDSILW